MKRYAALAILAVLFAAAAPGQAQFLKKLEDQFLNNGQGQGMMPGQNGGGVQQQMIGQVNLPPGQYMMTNTQTGQAFYVMVQNGQMFLSGGAGGAGMMQGNNMMPGGMMQQQQQGGGLGGMMKGGLGNFLKNELAPQGQQQVIPGQ